MSFSAVSELIELIRREIVQNEGAISFARFMQLCLHSENLGYYAHAESIFGERGDFVTSSEISATFAHAFAEHLNANKTQLQDYSLIEIGAGSGRFAAQLLSALKETGNLPKQYYIVETSAGLRTRQQNFLREVLSDEWKIIKWVPQLNEPLTRGVVIANEVLDALPVHLYSIQNNQVFERQVTWQNNQFLFDLKEVDQTTDKLVRDRIDDPVIWQLPTYNTEVCTQLTNFIEQTASFVKRGLFFLIDYGYPRREYYHAQRSMGTLLCHYQHQAHDNPLLWPGLQDLSCNVDFTALAEAGTQAELDLECYCTQAHFLLATSILDAANQSIEVSGELKKLLLPGEMGERFQVMVFSKQLSIDHNFAIRDLSHRL